MGEQEARLREEMVRYGNLLLERALVTGTGGNISVRLPDDRGMLITPSGMPYAEIGPEDIVRVDLAGNVVGGTRRPSIERLMHLEIYRRRPDVGAIVHTHPPFCTAVAACRRDLEPITDVIAAVFGGPVRTSAYARVGTPELACNVAEVLGQGRAALIANHGAVTVGPDLASAFDLCIILESCAQVFVYAHLLGQPVVLPPEVVREEKEDLARRYGQR